ncbi:MAG: DUF1080 domain-containing protein [bacterium]
MKNIFFSFILFVFSTSVLHAQSTVEKTIASFPYQRSADATASLTAMESWTKAEWAPVFNMLDDDSLKTNASFALSAYVHQVANAVDKSEYASSMLLAGLSSVKTSYAKDLLIEHLGLLGDDVSVKPLAKLLTNQTYAGSAARALASIRSGQSIAALSKALKKAKDPIKRDIQAAIDNANFKLPSIAPAYQEPKKVKNAAQTILDLQDRMDVANDPVVRRRILAEADGVKGFSSLVFVGKYLDDPDLQKQAANIAARTALSDKSISGKAVRDILEKAMPLLNGTDSAVLANNLKAHIKFLPYDYGFTSLFNGKDLTGWKGLVGNPISRSKMSADELLKAESAANATVQNDWVVQNGLLIFTGHGDNLCTEKKYGDFEMYVDWKITAQGDAGIYLRGTPQVQIWDTSRRDVGAQVGSGGLYNNQKNMSKPLVVADNKVGEWNTFHIIMKGERVTVYLNGVLVTDNVVLENYWDRALPIFVKEQIELQAHGTYVAYRNIYVRELPTDTKFVLNPEELKAGFEVLFDGANLDKWVGNKEGYLLDNGTMVVDPTAHGGGNIYTKDEYDNFNYRFEFQLTPGANNGLGIRAPLEGDAAYVGMELQILDSEAEIYKNLKPYQYHGSIYGVYPAKRGYLKPVGEWNQQEVVAKGTKIKVILNGQVILDTDIKNFIKNGTPDKQNHPGLARSKGHIGFLGHGDVLRFRNIRIKKL